MPMSVGRRRSPNSTRNSGAAASGRPGSSGGRKWDGHKNRMMDYNDSVCRVARAQCDVLECLVDCMLFVYCLCFPAVRVVRLSHAVQAEAEGVQLRGIESNRIAFHPKHTHIHSMSQWTTHACASV